MKIRPLKRIQSGYYISNDGNWEFIQSDSSWNVYSQFSFNGKIDEPFFYESYPTLKSLIKAVESLRSKNAL